MLTFKCPVGLWYIMRIHLPPSRTWVQECKAKMHLKETWTTTKKRPAPPLAQHHTAFKKKPFQQAKAKAIQMGSWFYRCWNSSVVEVPHFTEAPSPSQLQTPAAQNMLQSKNAPEFNLNNNKKNPHARASTTSWCVPLKCTDVAIAGAYRRMFVWLLGSGAGRVEGVCADWGTCKKLAPLKPGNLFGIILAYRSLL